MDRKVGLIVIFGIFALCHVCNALPVAINQFVPDGLQDVDDQTDNNNAHGLLVKREAPIYDSNNVKDDQNDLQTSATGYGHGGYAPTGYVSYGAKTGGYGAFSWYSDHPVGGGHGYH